MVILPSFSPPASTSKKTLLLAAMAANAVVEDENDSSGLKFDKGDFEAGNKRARVQEGEASRCRSRRRMLPDCQGCGAAGPNLKRKNSAVTSTFCC